MKVILVNKETITSKKGDEYVKVGFISVKDGKVGEIFTTRSQYESFGIKDSKFIDEETLGHLAKSVDETEVDFDQRGRLVNLE